jgi:hypothetical protein
VAPGAVINTAIPINGMDFAAAAATITLENLIILKVVFFQKMKVNL